MSFVIQAFGIMAVVSSLIIYRQKTRKRILSFKLIQDVCWFLHYFLLGAFSAAATSFLCISRSVVYYNNDKKFFASKLWLALYITLYAISAALTWSSIYSIFPALSSTLSSIGFWLKTPRHTKIVSICASLCTLVYNINISHSPAVYIGVSFTVFSASTSIIKEIMEKRKAKE